MRDFPVCEPDAMQRKNAWKIKLYTKGSFDRTTKTYTMPEAVKTYLPSDLITVESVEETKVDAKWQVVFKIRTAEYVPFDFAEVYAASYQNEYQTPPYYLIYKMPYRAHASSLTDGTTTVTLEMSQMTVDELLEDAPGTVLFAAALDAVYDEDEGDWTYHGDYETRVMLTFEHLVKAAGYATGTYPMITAETSDGIASYNASFQTDRQRYSHGDFYNDYEFRHYVSGSGLRGFIAARNDDGRETVNKVAFRVEKTGDVFLYKKASETPTEPVKTFTTDLYSGLEYARDADYGQGYTVECRGDIRLETGDTIAVEGVGNMRIERIEMSYDGTLSSTITASI